MKKCLVIMAPIAAILFSEGILFRLCHYPGGGYMLLIGGILGVLSAVLGLLYSLKQSGCKSIKWFVGISIIFTILMAIFKLLHFPGVGILCFATLGLIIPAMAIVLAISFNNKKD